MEKCLPTRSELHGTKCVRPSKDHSFIQEALFETCLVPIVTSGFLLFCDFASLYDTHVLVPHLAKMYVKCYTYNFSWMAYEDPFWKEQTTVLITHARAMLVALFHYKMHAVDVMRFLRGTYTGEHRDIDATVEILVYLDIDPWLIS